MPRLALAREFSSQLETMNAADEWLESVAREAGIDESTIGDMAICSSEIVNNAIRHGNGSDPERVVRVEVEIDEGEFCVLVSDQGTGFRPREDEMNGEAPMPDSSATHGRGVLICRALCDEVSYEVLQPHGTRVRLMKRYVPRASANHG